MLRIIRYGKSTVIISPVLAYTAPCYAVAALFKWLVTEGGGGKKKKKKKKKRLLLPP